MAGVVYQSELPKVSDNDIDAMFCSISCMKNPVKYIEYTHITEEDFQSKITTIKSTSEYYSKDSHDVAILIEFITKINKENDLDFNLNMDDIKLLLEDNGNFFLVKKYRDENKKMVKHRIHLRPIELRTV